MKKQWIICPECVNDVNDFIEEFGMCERCHDKKTMTSEQLKDEQRQNLVDLFESGHDVDLTQF